MDDLGERLRGEARHFGPELAQKAYERGLAVTSPDGSTRPIPITATPMVIEEAELRRRVALSALLASAAFKMARSTLAGPERELLLSALSPLERALAEQTFARAELLVTTRVDYFVARRAFALELNATIPAMQGYSDIAVQTFLEVVGRHLGLQPGQIAACLAQVPSNARALYEALLMGYSHQRPGRLPERIALLCRRNDAQLAEQRYLCRQFRAFGTEAEVVHPDQLTVGEALTANGKSYDLVYRHLFVRRLEEPSLLGAEKVRALLSQLPHPRAVVLNPPASQVEVKTTFALLSRATSEPELARSAGLTEDELSAIGETVPWTRSFDPELLEQVAAEPDRFVLKRAWDYGGRAVFLGHSRGEPSFDERVRAAYGRSLSWAELCERCLSDRAGGGFVVQERVPLAPEDHLLCGEQGVSPSQLYVDFSAYASVGLPRQPAWGAVCRGSVSQIVNIVGGGGVLPLLTAEAARPLAEATSARSAS